MVPIIIPAKTYLLYGNSDFWGPAIRAESLMYGRSKISAQTLTRRTLNYIKMYFHRLTSPPPSGNPYMEEQSPVLLKLR